MQDLWRLPAADLAALVKSKKVSAEGGRHGCAGAARCGQSQDQRRGRSPARRCAEAGRRGRCRDRKGRGCRHPCRRARYREGQCRPAGLCHHQRPEAAARRDRAGQLARRRQFPQSRRHHPWAHQLPGLLLSLVHHQSHSWRHQKSARPSITPGGSSGGAGAAVAAGIGQSRTAPISRARSAIPPMPAACTACGRRSAASPPSIPACRSAPSGRRSRRCPARWRAPSRICASRSPRCRRATCAIPGGCRRRWKAQRAEARRALSQPGRPRSRARGESRAHRRRRAAGARRLDGGGNSRTRRRCGSRRTGTESSGSATCTRRSSRPPRRRAIPARSLACAATAPK